MAITFPQPTSITGPQTPTPLTVDTFAAVIEQIAQYRTQIAAWSADLIRQVLTFISSYVTAVPSDVFPNLSLDGAGSKEIAARDDLLALLQSMKNQTSPILSSILDAIGGSIVPQITNPPTLDVQTILDGIKSAIVSELNSSTSSYVIWRELVDTIIDTALLDASYSLLAADTTDITATVDNFKINAKSQLDSKMFEVERRSINTLASKGILNSTISAETIARIAAQKGREFTEIDAQAEQLRQQLKEAAYARAIERMRTKIQAGALLPLQLPAGIYAMMGEIISARFLNPLTAIQAIPTLLGNVIGGLQNLSTYYQADRGQDATVDVNAFQSYANMVGIISANLARIYETLADISKFGLEQ